MRLADGVGLHASITVDPATANPVYAVETVQLDPATGDWVHEAEPSPGTATYQTREEWEAAISGSGAASILRRSTLDTLWGRCQFHYGVHPFPKVSGVGDA